MSEIEVKIQKKSNNEIISCYNCGIHVTEKNQKNCPNCQAILNPNTYINWKKSWYGFLCCLCITPFLIALLIILIL